MECHFKGKLHPEANQIRLYCNVAEVFSDRRGILLVGAVFSLFPGEVSCSVSKGTHATSRSLLGEPTRNPDVFRC